MASDQRAQSLKAQSPISRVWTLPAGLVASARRWSKFFRDALDPLHRSDFPVPLDPRAARAAGVVLRFLAAFSADDHPGTVHAPLIDPPSSPRAFGAFEPPTPYELFRYNLSNSTTNPGALNSFLTSCAHGIDGLCYLDIQGALELVYLSNYLQMDVLHHFASGWLACLLFGLSPPEIRAAFDGGS
jgi:hypothetical protein